jgi:hypothetical protein
MNVSASQPPVADRAQVAALPLMVGGDGIERVLLLTSRETKRWGHPERVAHQGAQTPTKLPPKKRWRSPA